MKNETRHTKIIALTASSLEEDRSVILDVGCDDYLRKPFREAELFELMSKHIGVKFVYEEDRNVANGKELVAEREILTEEALATLPEKWLVALKQAAEETDIEALVEIVEQIRKDDAILADALTHLIEEFEYDQILAVMPHTKNGGDAVEKHV